ncbi:PhoD-like phosphatase-domain-containing protein [Lipomyces japonicus]|uniref:PhoD-like phosphatase-domain-containing protein n=1 Tax=Lipomyces japonicus TaxID=56871 RepID=UPI0034CF65A2
MAQAGFFVVACGISSVFLRLVGYVFLRWFPSSIFPSIIFTFATIYGLSAINIWRNHDDHADKLESTTPGTSDSPERTASVDKQASAKISTHNSGLRKKSLFAVLFFGIPSKSRPILSVLAVLTNLTILMFALDFIYRSFYLYPEHDVAFTRLGHVSANSARLIVRQPNTVRPVEVRFTEITPLVSASEVFSHQTDFSNWNVAISSKPVDGQTDYTAVIDLSNLKPSTDYAFTSSSMNGTFTTSSNKVGSFSFLFTSCIKARVPYNPLDHPLAINGFRIHNFLLSTVDFFLFLGDFTYADVPKLLGTDVESYRRHYRQVYSDLIKTGFHQLPTVHVFDDHEIINDYDPKYSALYEPAIMAWKEYQGRGNPNPVRNDGTYYQFERQGIPFFLLDTRTFRSGKNVEDGPAKTMLGEKQLADLHKFLITHRSAPVKFIVSSCPFTKNWQGPDAKDTWAGYLHERSIVLNWLWQINDGGLVVILSGDRHEAAAIRFPNPNYGDQKRNARDVYEFSTSPFSQFYVPIRTHNTNDLEDVTIMYMPDGNSKVGKIDVNKQKDGTVEIVYRLFIDGEQKWLYELSSRSI